MRLSLVTINYNGSEQTKKLIDSLAEQTTKDFQTIVVDNNSLPGDLSTLKSELSELSTSQVNNFNSLLIENKKNLGFSGGNNIGIRQALLDGADWVLLLNNDSWVESGFIARLRAILEARGGILGLPLDEGAQTAYYGKIRWLRSTLQHSYRLSNFPAGKLYAIGGAIAIHKDVFEKIGLLDENYFLYFEDVDYSVRTLKNNISLEILSQPIVHHTPSSTTGKLGRPLLLRYHYRNALYFNLKNGPWHIRLAVYPWSLIIIAKQLFKILFMYRQEESSAILKGVLGFYIGKMKQII